MCHTHRNWFWEFTLNNPLLEETELPQFDKIQSHHIQPALEQILEQSRNSIKQLEKITDHVIVSGGGEIYKSLISKVDTLHISTIDIEAEGNVVFPEIPDTFKLVFEQDFESNINYCYQIWKKD